MAVVKCFTHRHVEADAQSTNEILVLVSIEQEAVHHLHLFTSTIEIETYHKGQLFASVFILMYALQFYQRAYSTATLYRR